MLFNLECMGFSMACTFIYVYICMYMHACSVTQLYRVPCDPLDCSPCGSSVHGIFLARILELAAISFSRGSSWPKDWIWSPALVGSFFTTEPPGKHTHTHTHIYIYIDRERVYVYDTYMFLLLIRCIVIIRFLTVFITLKSPELVI